ncbi:hypothetical protein EV401DRAFT_2064893 [Pisolithus croceorrhizus]|nr:hypothetical protein EV401DRAFT_2064893 [Pisolithus croceorrhizus]
MRHVEIYTGHVKAFFGTKVACPADGRKHSQVLKVWSLFEDAISALKEWLRRRSLEGKPALDVIMMDILLICSDSRRSALYESFRPYCNVVVPVDFDLTSGLSLSATSCERVNVRAIPMRVAKLPALHGLTTSRSGGASFVFDGYW